MNLTITPPSIKRVYATLKTVIRRTRSSDIGEPVTRWQLFNECSRGFLQSFLHTVNSLGRREDVCLSRCFQFDRLFLGRFQFNLSFGCAIQMERSLYRMHRLDTSSVSTGVCA